MAIRIIGEAREVYKQVTCKSCASILEYTPSDLKHWKGKDYSGGSAGSEWIDCPKCGTKVIVRAW